MDKKELKKWSNTIKLQSDRLKRAQAKLTLSVQLVQDSFDGLQETISDFLEDLDNN